MRLGSVTGAQGNAAQPIRDVDAIRTYLSGQGPVAILDMPWMPLYLAFVFILHPVLGGVTVFGALFLIALTLLTERLMQEPSEAAVMCAKRRWAIAEASDRNAEVLQAMGFGSPLLAPAGGRQQRAYRCQRAAERPGGRLLLGVAGCSG